MTESKIYVGLNDSETMQQVHETDKYVKILKGVCRSYGVAFSFSVAQGGYIHEDGTYTQENSLILSLVGTERAVVDAIAGDLCAFFHQESVMVTETEVNRYFVSEKI